jgi:hypothetical protein
VTNSSIIISVGKSSLFHFNLYFKSNIKNMSFESEIVGYYVPNIILSEIFSKLLSLQDICRLDSAICNTRRRPLFLGIIRSESCIFLGDRDWDFTFARLLLGTRQIQIRQLKCDQKISWLSTQQIKIRHLKCCQMTDHLAIKISCFGSALHWLSIADSNMIDESLINITNGCPGLESVTLTGCVNISDRSIVKLAEGCLNLKSLDIVCCYRITEMGIIRIAERCRNLR